MEDEEMSGDFFDGEKDLQEIDLGNGDEEGEQEDDEYGM